LGCKTFHKKIQVLQISTVLCLQKVQHSKARYKYSHEKIIRKILDKNKFDHLGCIQKVDVRHRQKYAQDSSPESPKIYSVQNQTLRIHHAMLAKCREIEGPFISHGNVHQQNIIVHNVAQKLKIQ
jgi:hypothetical protein